MNPKSKNEILQGSLFEKDYLLRTLGALVIYPEIAITELVANAWDAGATNVHITIPDTTGEKLVIEDNGVGLSKEQFEERWMKLGYNRLSHQGKNVIFPTGVNGKRFAYGRNGVGRHGLLCFNNEYTVITNSEGKKSIFVITTQDEKHPFVIKDFKTSKSTNAGTRLEVIVNQHLPNSEKMLEIISTRFLHDPSFKVYINNKTVPLEDLSGLINTEKISLGNILLTAHFIDSQKTSRKTLYHGIAFWQSGRLVGEPNWILNFENIIDGRTTFAKRYTVVIETNDLAEYIYEDWTGFKNVPEMKKVYEAVGKYILDMFGKLSMENISEHKQFAKNEFATEILALSSLGRYEVNEVIEDIIVTNPTAKQESISIAIKAIINLEKTRTGKELLLKLSELNEADVIGLNTLLEKWTVRDALTVLEEIDNRLSVIEAIRKLSADKDVDELQVLHPLVTNARWLFGPEFESAEYSSNRQLQNAVQIVFNKKISKDNFVNHKKRPDLVVLQNSTLSVTGTETFESDSSLSQINKILIIELKKGGFKLSRDERNQATGYVEDFSSCGSIIGNPYIEAYVIGHQYNEKVQPTATVKNSSDVEVGKIRIATYGQIVDTAQKRLFGLRNKLSERYDDLSGMELFKNQGVQLNVDFKNTEILNN